MDDIDCSQIFLPHYIRDISAILSLIQAHLEINIGAAFYTGSRPDIHIVIQLLKDIVSRYIADIYEFAQIKTFCIQFSFCLPHGVAYKIRHTYLSCSNGIDGKKDSATFLNPLPCLWILAEHSTSCHSLHEDRIHYSSLNSHAGSCPMGFFYSHSSEIRDSNNPIMIGKKIQCKRK